MRCCYGCIKEDRIPPVIPLAEAQRRLKRGAAHIYNLIPVVSGQLGIYSWLEREWKKKLRIVAEEHVSGISEYQNPNNNEPKRIRANRSLDSILRYMASTALP
ncbi:uncharacterized protein BDW43DRAFT_201974 [Aspergillus alliaceus]|uniref:uncharacterized protein n=1 Tax=Petromyces alliaceus TaxID=209559 RepID=UPI0012A41709|nr:uncharacterized protein BDW43DRAFT_201974 [Aspergillus alliaceus]KAB8237179.1 hypothetical protein BDW43DRAFT_201974 [Aspergillus alliaceus]